MTAAVRTGTMVVTLVATLIRIDPPPVGRASLRPRRARARRDLRLRVSWEHPLNWNELEAVELRVRRGRKVLGRVLLSPGRGKARARGGLRLAGVRLPRPGLAARKVSAVLRLRLVRHLGKGRRPWRGGPAGPTRRGRSGYDGTVGRGHVLQSFRLPAAWTELTAARGRYLVGLPAGGSLGAVVGTALAAGENRAVALHGHSVTDPGHSHSTANTWGNADEALSGTTTRPLQAVRPSAFAGTLAINSASTGIGVQNAGTVAGTTAPYMALRVCLKD